MQINGKEMKLRAADRAPHHEKPMLGLPRQRIKALTRQVAPRRCPRNRFLLLMRKMSLSTSSCSISFTCHTRQGISVSHGWSPGFAGQHHMPPSQGYPSGNWQWLTAYSRGGGFGFGSRLGSPVFRIPIYFPCALRGRERPCVS